ncbi:MAG: rhodanese-like domain-containing protein [Pseudomonadota bacterium]
MPLERTAAALIAAARSGLEALTPAQLIAEWPAEATVLVDLREREEIARDGLLPGAIHVPRGLLEFAADSASPLHNPALSPERRVILYCASGGRSALGAKALREMGYTRLAHLEGGVLAWKAQGLPLSGACGAVPDPSR